MNHNTMKKFVEIASENLTGEWVVIGGTVMAVLGIEYRVTVDIDFVNLKNKSSNSDSLKLMEIAEQLSLPIESINQAGAYFLSKINDVQDHLVVVKETKNCKVYRPDVYLFVRLKLGRFTQTDLEDCLVMIKHHEDEFQSAKKELLKLVKAKISSKETVSEELKKRLNAFLEKCIFKG
jgi:hypothetical protein